VQLTPLNEFMLPGLIASLPETANLFPELS